MTETPIRLMNAALQPPTPEAPKLTEATLYFLDKNDKEFLVCQLSDSKLNANMDLVISNEDAVSFRIKGDGIVHLSGFYEYDDDSDSDSSVGTSKSAVQTAQQFQGLQLASGSSGFGGEPDFGAPK